MKYCLSPLQGYFVRLKANDKNERLLNLLTKPKVTNSPVAILKFMYPQKILKIVKILKIKIILFLNIIECIESILLIIFKAPPTTFKFDLK